ncbi:MAG: hypothetical protein KJ826_08755 [Proteobacteria bacterium]|nr:hypothetical protein [Pseudomonadota bacterium]MBU4037465.1 hypothetical protein [Pseudomonadota bacterium]
MNSISGNNSLSKRIKRHVVGREKSFYASTSPGLEPVCLHELNDELKAILSQGLIPGEPFIADKGGIHFKGRLQNCYIANLYLRTANRILMRLGEFKATNFMQLEKKLSTFPWELYLPVSTNYIPEIKVSTKQSRLYHKEAISEIFTESISKRFTQNGTLAQGSSQAQKVFVRAVNDRFEISIDSSGELLYRRGIKTHMARAPLRETIAAAILKLCGYNGSEPLIDPMCGSGTFSIEAAMMAQNIPAGLFRDFAFINWPCFGSESWEYIKQKAKSQIKMFSIPSIFASDTDLKACDVFMTCIKQYDFLKMVEVRQKDFFDLSSSLFKDKTGLVVINPPYGHRIGSQSESIKLFQGICKKLKKDFSGWKVGIIASDINFIKYLPFTLESQTLFHGGLNIYLLYGRIT